MFKCNDIELKMPNDLTEQQLSFSLWIKCHCVTQANMPSFIWWYRFGMEYRDGIEYRDTKPVTNITINILVSQQHFKYRIDVVYIVLQPGGLKTVDH